MHIVEAIIAKKEITKDIEERFVLAKSIELAQGYAMVPLTDELKDDIDDLVGNENIVHDCFEKLSYSICEVILDTARSYEVAYIETEYFGGEGGQSAMVWKDGKVVFGPTSSKDTDSPINEALKTIGVRVIKKQDEFDEMKLGWNRDTEKWYKSSS
jgi:hypothetical protein